MKRILQTNADSARIAGEDLSDIEAAAVELEERLAQIEAHADQQLQNGADRFQVAAFAYQTGAVHLAIRTVEDDPIYKQKNQIARNSLGAWLIEVGRIQEGLDTLEQASGEGGMPGWQDSLATSMLINGDYARAIDLWKEQITETNSNVGQAVIQTMPFLTLNSTWMTADQYPFTHAAAAAEVLGRVRNENAALTYQIAQAQLELGDVAAASQSLQFVFDKAPNMPLQTLVKFYLGALRGEKVADPSVEPPVLEEFLPLDEEPAKKDPQPAADKASPASTKTEDKN
jgi:Tfp pilus assembly protein PilF